MYSFVYFHESDWVGHMSVWAYKGPSVARPWLDVTVKLFNKFILAGSKAN